MQFFEYQVLKAKNLLCCTTQLVPENLAADLREIGNLLESNSVSKLDTTLYLIICDFGNPNITLNISTKKGITNVRDPFWLKEKIHLIQAVRTRHEGDLFELWGSISQAKKYLCAHNLPPITPYYCKVLVGLETPEDTQSIIMDIYVGVNCNVL